MAKQINIRADEWLVRRIDSMREAMPRDHGRADVVKQATLRGMMLLEAEVLLARAERISKALIHDQGGPEAS